MKQFFKQLIDGLKSCEPDSSSVDSEHRVHLAASVIFLEMAATDSSISDDELSEISRILRTHYALKPEEVKNLMENARAARNKAVDIYGFTRILNDECSYDEKLRLIEQVWRIVYADGKLDMHEDHLVHKIARLLHINHQDMIDAKLTARSQA